MLATAFSRGGQVFEFCIKSSKLILANDAVITGSKKQ
jgi:hypothetical protein